MHISNNNDICTDVSLLNELGVLNGRTIQLVTSKATTI